MMLYRLVRAVVVGVCRAGWRVKVIGRDRLPSRGAYILAPSHRSLMDIPFLSLVTPRRIHFMAKQELMGIPGLGATFRTLGAFAVARDGSDARALRTALEMLAGDEPLAVYPEGTRGAGPKIGDLHEGAAYLAVRAGVPIVPVGIAGSEEIMGSGKSLPRPGRATVVVGPPLLPPPRSGSVVKRDVVRELTGRLRDALQETFDAAHATNAAR